VAHSESRDSRLRSLLSTAPVLFLLLAVLLHGTAEKLHARLLGYGQKSWPGYAQLRVDPVKPSCDPKALAMPASAPGSMPGGAKAAVKDDVDDLLGEETVNVDAAKKAAEAAQARCLEEHAAYTESVGKLTKGLRFYRGLERGTAALVDFESGFLQHVLVLLLLICAATTTAIRSHIALRNPKSRRDYLVADGTQLIANLLLTASSIAQVRVDRGSGVAVQHAELAIIWACGFGLLAAINIYNLLRPPKDATPGGSFSHAMLCGPPFAAMGIIAGAYFILKEGHYSGLAIYLQKLTEHALIYLQVGLYVWVGMILKRTRIAHMAFDVIRPWRLPPEVLAGLVVVLAAFPTAYSGASGIFVMAAGPIIYAEMRRAGARPQLAIAATSMSGSLGVSIQPCLLVVIIAALNKEVTTEQIYGWGWKIYLLAAAALVLGALALRWRKLKEMAPPSEAAPVAGRNLLGLVPFAVIAALVVAFYQFGLGTKVNEHTAPTVLPVLLLLLLIYDARGARKAAAQTSLGAAAAPAPGSGRLLVAASSETTGHIGALLMLMGCSVCLGGIVERSNIMGMIGGSLGSPVAAMALLVGIMVLIGMSMDPYGAVILVSVTLAPVAYKNGIAPVHFWAMVLCAFELGYLTPAIGLNKLLSRRIVEEVEPEVLAQQAGQSFYARNEAVILNCSIMTIMLLIVAFLPFLWLK
jgi:TRAP-type C4-dicarboxylate transport system permease large subunit